MNNYIASRTHNIEDKIVKDYYCTFRTSAPKSGCYEWTLRDNKLFKKPYVISYMLAMSSEFERHAILQLINMDLNLN